MIQTMTLEHSKTKQRELDALTAAMRLIGEKRYDAAMRVLIARHDELTRAPEMKLYDPRVP